MVLSPARSTADLTWAEATGGAYSIGSGSRAPRTVSGSRPPAAQSKCAPIRASGPVTRAIGRRRREASPVITARRSWLARMPSSSRAAVPALPISSTESGSASPPGPTPSTVQAPSSCRSTGTPSWRSAPAVARTSAPSSRPATPGPADSQRPEHQGAMRDRLVAGRHGNAAELPGAPRNRGSGCIVGNVGPGSGHREALDAAFGGAKDAFGSKRMCNSGLDGRRLSTT